MLKALRRPVVAAVIGVLLLWARTASRAEEVEDPLEAIESITIEEVLPNGRGELSLRLNAEYARAEGESVARLPALEINLGLTDSLDAELEVPLVYAGGSEAFGFGDIAATFKYLLIKSSERCPAFVIGIDAEFPTGSVRRQLGEGVYEAAPLLLVGKAFGPVVVQGSVGWAHRFASSTGSREESVVYGLSVAVPLSRSLYAFGELNGARASRHSESHLTVAPGLKYLLGRDSFIAVALPVLLEEGRESAGVITQIQWGL